MWLLLALTLASSGASGQAVPERPGSFREEARVERVIVDAYVTQASGTPIPDLGPSDFALEVDGLRVPLESAEWIPAEMPEVPELAEPKASRSGESAAAPPPPGRLLIFFFQTNYEGTRLTGLVRMGLQARRFLESLLPTDRVAVLSFDSHLKLRQDFTGDRRKIEAAIDRSLRMGPPPAPDPESEPALARRFDFRAARRAVTPESALALIGRAAAPIPGGKSMLFFGWGLGTIGGLGGPIARERRDWSEAMGALGRARISIFTLDVTDADFHSLEVSLEQISDLTGGVYQKTHLFPGQAMDRVERALSGRYVLVFRKPQGARGEHSISVRLLHRKGRVLARGYYVD